jgi:MFS family permease
MARDLRIFYLFRLLATSYFYVPIFFFFKVARGLDFDEIFWLSAVYAGTVIVFEIPTGAFADRIGRRTSMMAGALAMVISCLVAYHADGFRWFALSESLAAISMSLCSGADSAYLYDLLHAHGRGAEYAHREGTATAWHLCGNSIFFAASGYLAQIDLALPYLATACTAGLAFVVGVTLRTESWMPRARVTRPLREDLVEYCQLMKRSVTQVVHTRQLVWLIGYSAVVFPLVVITKYVYQPYLESRGFDYVDTGLVFAALHLVAAAVAVSVFPLRRKLGERGLLWGLLGTLALSFFLLERFHGAVPALCMLALQAGATGIFSPLVKPILNREIVDSRQRATMLSVESIARRASATMMHPMVGLFSLAAGIYLCGAFGLVGLLVLAATFRSAPRLDRPLKPLVDSPPASEQTVPPCSAESSANGEREQFTSSPSVAPRTGSTASSCSEPPTRAVTRL